MLFNSHCTFTPAFTYFFLLVKAHFRQQLFWAP